MKLITMEDIFWTLDMDGVEDAASYIYNAKAIEGMSAPAFDALQESAVQTLAFLNRLDVLRGESLVVQNTLSYQNQTEG